MTAVEVTMAEASAQASGAAPLSATLWAENADLAARILAHGFVRGLADGRVARLTHTQSAFGAEFDSLADMVSFGAAPALVISEWSLRGLGNSVRVVVENTQGDIFDPEYLEVL